MNAMQIIYNPESGAPIQNFIAFGSQFEPHYPDGYELDGGKIDNGLRQYDDAAAKEILETFGFLEVLTKEQAEAILARPPKEKYVCDFPGCEFKTHAKIAFNSHQRKHARDRAADTTPVIEEDKIPVAAGKKALSLAEKKQLLNNDATNSDLNLPAGADKDGVEWYGEGVTIDKPQVSENGFGPQRAKGKGHFGG